ncbi:MAG TPA: hypothetical protein VNL17_14735 [Verrucomicrobiae bacterium]|nr:hypothetical protein [Verrucomicrobiae bacterium]
MNEARYVVGLPEGGMKIVIVPNELRDAINAHLDAAIARAPGAEMDREYFYSVLLAFFDENGYLPDFTLEKFKTVMTITDLLTEIDRMIAENNDPAALANLGAVLQVRGDEAIRKAVEIVLKKGGRAA